ncbi:MAG: DNA-3-methyladenine glycosylase 2 family protein [Candidatus Thermoplasmatota archaeon]|jgi:DNA-3-methyladenine glycosylase II|nr:DNA-3-methyladenine glycosylase 2 family protein [Candidatus Thermoplasmatota archaeon]
MTEELGKKSQPYADIMVTAYNHLASIGDPLSHIVRSVGVLEFKPDPDIFRNACESIICQQLSSKVADVILKRVYATLPNGELSPKNILDIDTAVFRECGISYRKIEYIKEFSGNVLHGTIDLGKLQDAVDDEVIEILTASRGIGNWTAKMILIFSMGRTDVLAHEDLGIRIAVKKIYGMEILPGREQLENIAEAWRPYRSVSSMYLWKHRDGAMNTR